MILPISSGRLAKVSLSANQLGQFHDGRVMMMRDKRLWSRTILWGTISAALYATLFIEADKVIAMARETPQRPWLVLVPIAIAFAISFAHGAFTGLFWEAMGLKAATKHKPPQAAGQE
ncbi:MAG: hypothetical protein ACK4E4_03510 [Rhodocyclaceae bacterium]